MKMIENKKNFFKNLVKFYSGDNDIKESLQVLQEII